MNSLTPVPDVPEPPATAAPAALAERWSRRRVWLARALALAVDALQIVLLPLVLGGAVSPVTDVLDVFTTIAMVALLGWHWAFLPTAIAELVPFIDLYPTWTIAVLFVTRKSKRAQPASASSDRNMT